jgi:outer membrane lipase/esterase
VYFFLKNISRYKRYAEGLIPVKSAFLKSVAMSLLCGGVVSYGPIFASSPKEIVVLGDSLSDSGNSRPVAGFFDLPPVTLPYLRFCPITDGVTWPVLLSEQLAETRLTPFTRGGTNYAYVAASTVNYPSLFPPVNPSMTDQVGLIPSSVSRKDPAFIFGGANDIYAFDPLLNPNAGHNAAVNLSAILTSMHKLGFKYLIILNMPDIGATPSVLGTANAPIYTVQSGELNRELQTQLHTIGFPVFEVDIASFFANVLQNYQQYGFSSVTTSPNPTPYPLPFGEGTAGFAFWYDGTHFSEALHQLVSDYVFSLLSGAECFATLAETPFAVLREQVAGIRQELYPNQPLRKANTYYFFTNGTYAPMALPALSDSCRDNVLHGGNIAFGVLDQITKAWNLGIAGEASWNEYHCHTQTTRCEYDLNALTLSIFGGWTAVTSSPTVAPQEVPECHQGGYVNAVANIAFLDFDHIKRKFSVGPVSQETHSDTDGMDYYGLIYGAYYIPTCSRVINTGPLANVEYQFVHVDGFSESDLDYGNLVFKDQHNSSCSTGLGWEVRFEYPSWLGDLFLSINRQWLGAVRNIHFREKTLPATNGIWPTKMPRTTFVSGGINASISCRHSIQLSLGYTFNIGVSEIPMREQFISLNLSL